VSSELPHRQRIEGLSESDVAARVRTGRQNVVQYPTGRSYLQILRKNAFTFINTVLFAIAVVLILMGHVGDAAVTAGLVLLNVVAGVVQEGRAKRKLDRIALLARPRATVIRGGEERTVDPSEIVLGDVLVARPGDQIVVDGEIIGEGRVEVDESLLTGESERIQKGPGDRVYSGTFCVRGSAVYEAQAVGSQCVVNQLTAGARAFRQVKTPLQKEIDFIIRILVLVVAALGVLLGVSFALRGLPMVEGVRAAAVIVALVPQGLFFMTTVAYAMGVVRVAVAMMTTGTLHRALAHTQSVSLSVSLLMRPQPTRLVDRKTIPPFLFTVTSHLHSDRIYSWGGGGMIPSSISNWISPRARSMMRLACS